MKNLTLRLASFASIIALSLLSTTGTVLGASNSNLTQAITAGTLTVDILDASRVAVGSPSVAMSSKSFSFDCLTGGSASTGTLGTNTQRVYAINPGATTPNGWNVTIAATSGATAVWANGGSTKTFDYNDASSSGCTDGADADTVSGQMTIDPSVSTLTTDCTTCALTGVTKGSSTAFVQGTTNSVTLMTASSSVSNPFRAYMTGAGISQTIPGEQSPDPSYSLGMTLTITAL